MAGDRVGWWRPYRHYFNNRKKVGPADKRNGCRRRHTQKPSSALILDFLSGKMWCWFNESRENTSILKRTDLLRVKRQFTKTTSTNVKYKGDVLVEGQMLNWLNDRTVMINVFLVPILRLVPYLQQTTINTLRSLFHHQGADPIMMDTYSPMDISWLERLLELKLNPEINWNYDLMMLEKYSAPCTIPVTI